ncbi:transcriptional regulator [Pseudomonas savastanoi pv. retacarpa]|uniref:Transcriptional regulator n=2 Tax=Pseudomonas savastanoi TaxID=29438 RepID=A0AB73QWA0_PSESS|nr:hypothetical protein PSA3335_27300 [Pseudomonas savastanoi pv. savastanoi NCPPB 3335]KAA3545180.1 XRE family transcriptional regulator [Pseudomonas savastanoi]KPW65128.1 DNA-binding protein [Pseudomonas amygdali pv. ciccaronei]KPY04922.1 hypothetical protein ALO61_200012 [Pseudomonas savastanoi pv. nerii]KPY39345.1 DNA-binding protein [Pseudomonas savastanoi pv. retacarpa]KWS77846.1 hypothetical protein AL053_17305 [Pseudomonas savastanoi pv. fraxini]MBA4702687.1 helix-turn-helix transcrip
MSQAAFVNPSILTWSRERAGLSAAQVARKLPVKPERIKEWEAGKARPTFLQAQKWASVAHVPFGFLFLPQPPVEQLPLPDLRTVGNSAPLRPSLELVDTVTQFANRTGIWNTFTYKSTSLFRSSVASTAGLR